MVSTILVLVVAVTSRSFMIFSSFIIASLNFNLSGMKPLVITLLHLIVRGELMKGAVIFSNLFETSSYPYEFFSLRVLIMFSISVVLVGLL